MAQAQEITPSELRDAQGVPAVCMSSTRTLPSCTNPWAAHIVNPLNVTERNDQVRHFTAELRGYFAARFNKNNGLTMRDAPFQRDCVVTRLFDFVLV